MFTRRLFALAGLLIMLGAATAEAQTPPPGPAYQIVLRSRRSAATPTRVRDSQTGGGAIFVEQPEPNTVVVTMTGSAAAASDFCDSRAEVVFDLGQDLEIIPTRGGVRPPRIGLVAKLVGTVQVTYPCGCCLGTCGSAGYGPATACLSAGGTELLSVSLPPEAASCGQQLAVNHREGPYEAVAAPGAYHLAASFRLGAAQGKGVFYRQYAVADFDPAPQLDPFWADALAPFRALPRPDFGFRFVLRVVEDPLPPGVDVAK